MSARYPDPCGAWQAAPQKPGHCGPTTWETCPRQRRRSAPQLCPPVRPRSQARRKPLAVLFGRSCCLDMKTPPAGGQVSDVGIGDMVRIALFGGLEERGGPGQKLL